MLLEGISKMIKDPRFGVRSSAITVFFTTLNHSNFTEEQLNYAYSHVFINIFDNFKGDLQDKE